MESRLVKRCRARWAETQSIEQRIIDYTGACVVGLLVAYFAAAAI